jgi:hypothetical protein
LLSKEGVAEMSKETWENTPIEVDKEVEVVQTPPGMHPARKEVTAGHYKFVFEEEDILQIEHDDGRVFNFTPVEAYALLSLLYDHRELLHRLSNDQHIAAEKEPPQKLDPGMGTR